LRKLSDNEALRKREKREEEKNPDRKEKVPEFPSPTKGGISEGGGRKEKRIRETPNFREKKGKSPKRALNVEKHSFKKGKNKPKNQLKRHQPKYQAP